MKYKGINHLALATRDISMTVRFWRDLLGMRLVAALGKPGYRQYFFEVSADDLVAFFEWPDVEPIEEKDAGRVAKGPFAFDHVAIGVEDDDALWAMKEKLEANGIWVSEVIDNGFIHSIFTFDPNGISLEFSCFVKNIDIRLDPIIADKIPPEVTKEGPDAQAEKWKEAARTTPPSERKIYPGEMKLYVPLTQG
ncbi:MAG: VOC family protein [Dissulfurispiraceae bacterium]|jgi:catechol 2,3-dioxygenase-like lactoylglutathione lyase family enzyme